MITNKNDLDAAINWLKRTGRTSARLVVDHKDVIEYQDFRIVPSGPDKWLLNVHMHEGFLVAPWLVEELCRAKMAVTAILERSAK